MLSPIRSGSKIDVPPVCGDNIHLYIGETTKIGNVENEPSA